MELELRILVVEDNEHRLERFRRWIPRIGRPVKVIEARSAGIAIGILARDRGRTFDGILLDHDLTESCVTNIDELISGKEVVDAIVEHISRDVPVLIHSANTIEAPKMLARLLGVGFSTEYQPFGSLRHDLLRDWMQYVAELSDAVPLYARWKQERAQSHPTPRGKN